ncbi:MAG: transcription initiation factor IIB family protein [Candidatus Thermoplasmatota archaeon]|nr:transcription initiation factor IIB family protein [Candidatus Thermoplasmatota archaeon]MCL5983614.1 transcription initiation factor IIB family protein [Candidatus Thermoplasmatota archaeon]
MTSVPTASPGSEEPLPACPLCGSVHRITDPMRSEVHCADCGLVFEAQQLVATAPIIPVESESDGSGRGIGPFSQATNARGSLGTTLNLSRDGQGRRLDSKRRYEFQHLKRVMQRQTNRGPRTVSSRTPAHGEIAAACERLVLPPLIGTEAERIFREARCRGLSRGRSLESCVGAAVYAACRVYSVPRTLTEVADAVGASRTDVGRAFKVLSRAPITRIPSIGLKGFLARYAEELALSPMVRSTVEAMLDEAHKSPELSGLSPHGLVAAMICVASDQHGEKRSRAQIARVSAVTEVTLRSTRRILERALSNQTAPTGP